MDKMKNLGFLLLFLIAIAFIISWAWVMMYPVANLMGVFK